MLVEILQVIDAAAQIVRVRGSVGVFDGFWMNPDLPSVGDRTDVEINLGHEVKKWGEDIVEAGDDASTGMAFADDCYYATGLAEWDGWQGCLSLSLAYDCLTSIRTVGRPDQPCGAPAGMLTVRAREIELWDTHL